MSSRSRIALLALALAACSTDVTAPAASDPLLHRTGDRTDGAVYTLSNSAAGNQVIAFRRAANGSLTPAGSYATGGSGSGMGLGSQGAVVITGNGRYLLAVNAGSDQLSSLAVGHDGALSVVSVVSSGGAMPISVTVDHDIVYVLNAGGTGNISGFRLSHMGALAALPGSTRPLSGPATGPAQVLFDPSGDFLVVTEKNTNLIDTYRVDNRGYATGPTVNASAGVTPFGFAFNRQGVLVVSEAAGGAPDASTASSYTIRRDGTLRVITAAAPTTESSACWVAINGSGRFAYTANTGSASMSGFAVRHGRLTLLDANGRTGTTGGGPADAAFSIDSRYLYVRNGGSQSISIFAADNGDGSLASLGTAALPPGAVGLAAR